MLSHDTTGVGPEGAVDLLTQSTVWGTHVLYTTSHPHHPRHMALTLAHHIAFTLDTWQVTYAAYTTSPKWGWIGNRLACPKHS